MALTAWDEQEFYRDRQNAIATAGARTGRSIHRVASKGAGQTHLVQPIAFQLTFVSQPTFTSGVALASGQLSDGYYPIVTCGVYKWQTDARKFFTGAWLWFGVDVAPTHVSTAGLGQLGLDSAIDAVEIALALGRLQLEHHLCFEGLAMRDVNYDDILAG